MFSYANQYDTKIYGLPNYLIAGQFERTDELNHRIRNRQFSDYPLQPQFGIQSISTRQTHFPIGIKATQIETQNINLQNMMTPKYNPEKNFNPASRAPIDYYYSNISLENELIGITKPLQKGIQPNDYVPNSNSELYIIPLAKSSYENDTTKHPYLIHLNERLQTKIPSTIKQRKFDSQRFNNFTKFELKKFGNNDYRYQFKKQ